MVSDLSFHDILTIRADFEVDILNVFLGCSVFCSHSFKIRERKVV